MLNKKKLKNHPQEVELEVLVNIYSNSLLKKIIRFYCLRI